VLHWAKILTFDRTGKVFLICQISFRRSFLLVDPIDTTCFRSNFGFFADFRGSEYSLVEGTLWV